MNTKNTLSVLIWANSSKKDKNGLIPLYARLTVNSIRSEISLNKKISANMWCKESSGLKGRDAESKSFNNHLSKVKSDINTHFLTLCAKNNTVTAEMLRNSYLGKEESTKSKTLLELFDYHNQKFNEKVAVGKASNSTSQRFETCLQKIKVFMKETLNKNDISLPDLKLSFITEFEHYLTVKSNLQNNSAMKYIKTVKKILNMAVMLDWIPASPFRSFKCTYINPEREILTKEEILVLFQKQMPNKRLDEVRDVFVFACYTGFAFCDLEALEQDAVSIGIDSEKWIRAKRIKTNTAENVMLLDIPLAIIEKHKTHPYCMNKNKLLPVISNQKYNAYLKEIATICNINKNLTSHMARHTFATTITLANGISLESVSAMLGHKSILTTQIYAKVVQSKLSSEMKSLKQKLSEPANTKLSVYNQ